MAYTTSTLTDGEWTIAREATAIIAADSATLTDANILPAEAIDCRGLESIYVTVAITAGTNPGMTIEALYRDGNAADGTRWVRAHSGSALIATTSLTPGVSQEITVHGHSSVFLRITAVANATSTTAWKILARPGQRRRDRARFR